MGPSDASRIKICHFSQRPLLRLPPEQKSLIFGESWEVLIMNTEGTPTVQCWNWQWQMAKSMYRRPSLVLQKSMRSMSQQLTVLFFRVWNLQNDLDVLAKSRKARLLNKWKERHGIPEAGTCWGLWDHIRTRNGHTMQQRSRKILATLF